MESKCPEKPSPNHEYSGKGPLVFEKFASGTRALLILIFLLAALPAMAGSAKKKACREKRDRCGHIASSISDFPDIYDKKIWSVLNHNPLKYELPPEKGLDLSKVSMFFVNKNKIQAVCMSDNPDGDPKGSMAFYSLSKTKKGFEVSLGIYVRLRKEDEDPAKTEAEICAQLSSKTICAPLRNYYGERNNCGLPPKNKRVPFLVTEHFEGVPFAIDENDECVSEELETIFQKNQEGR